MSSEQQIIKESMKTKKLSHREMIRHQAILFKLKGLTHREIVDLLDISEYSLQEWITAYNRNGVQGLLTKKPEEAHNKLLTNKERKEVAEILINQTPRDFEFNEDFWTIPILRKVIEKKYKVRAKWFIYNSIIRFK
ncbi:MAG: helix-turn-helix domain-containing protein [Candidatus Dojkabacteria bacterium]